MNKSKMATGVKLITKDLKIIPYNIVMIYLVE